LGARLSIVGLVPATAGLMALGPFLTSVIFLGRTSVPEARLIGSVLALAAIGLLPYALVMLQLRAFYVMRDARTPALVNGCMALVEIAFVVPASILLDGDRVIEALGLGTAVSYVIGAVLGHRLLRGRVGLLGFASVGRLLARVGLASAAAGAGAYLVGSAVNHALDGGRAGALGALVAGVGTGLLLLLIGARLLRISELRSLTSLIR
jgi:putative peptidoglycan lipid II flippase